MISIDKSALYDYTLLPNSFIDSYLTDSDGDHLKVYIYILRHSDDKAALDMPSMCKGLDLSERKILNGLKHWEAEGLLELFTTSGSLSGIRFLSPDKAAKAKGSHRLTNERIRQLKDSDQSKQLVFIAESYFGRPVTPTEHGSLLYLNDKLGFSVDLCDYLLQYSVSHGAKNMKYAEKVALAWHEEGIKTVEQAMAHSKIKSAADQPQIKINADGTKNETSVRLKSGEKNTFNNFDQHDYDMKALLKKAKGKQNASD